MSDDLSPEPPDPPSVDSPGTPRVFVESVSNPVTTPSSAGRGRIWALWLLLLAIAQVPFFVMSRASPPAPTAPASARVLASASSSAQPASSASATPFALNRPQNATLFVIAIEDRSCKDALGSVIAAASDIDSLVQLDPSLSNCKKGERLSVYLQQDRVIELDHERSPGDVTIVARQDAGFAAQNIKKTSESKQLKVAFELGSDYAKSIADAGLDPSLLELLDEALSARHDVGTPKPGSIFRVVVDSIFLDGKFDRYRELLAVEYRASRDAAPVRLYRHPTLSSFANSSFFDAKGRQPVEGGKWRMPVAFPRITSRFNPHRMHPILHVVMPHNGCDFAVSVGTPIYSIGAGTVQFRGDAGPSGNLVTIAHEDGFESGYAHLSRFAPAIAPGTHVEAHTLVGYSGTTGRSTGPHLHLSVKHHGVFIDPLSLKLDGVRVVPSPNKTAFAQRKNELDPVLDSIALPAPQTDLPGKPAPSSEPNEPEPLEEAP